MVANKIALFKMAINRILESKLSIASIDDLLESLREIKGITMLIKRNSEQQRELNTLTKSQKKLYDLSNKLYCHLNNCAVLHDGKQTTLWNLPEVFDSDGDMRKLSFKNIEEVKGILEICHSIFIIVYGISNPTNIFLYVRNFLFDRTLGTLNYVLFNEIVGAC